MINTILEIACKSECAKCGSEISVTTTRNNYDTIILKVDPCDRCLDKAEERGDEKGYDRGLNEGKTSPAF